MKMCAQETNKLTVAQDFRATFSGQGHSQTRHARHVFPASCVNCRFRHNSTPQLNLAGLRSRKLKCTPYDRPIMSLSAYFLLALSSMFVIVNPIATVPAFIAMTATDTLAARVR